MNIDIVYLHVVEKCHPSMPDPKFYQPFTNRFLKTFSSFTDLTGATMHNVFCGPGVTTESECLHWHFYDGAGKDIGAHQKVARELTGDFAVFFATVAYLWKAGWLGRLKSAFEQFGEGLYGSMASYENSPHIRTSCFACHPKLLAAYPVLIDTVEKCVMFESCQGGFTDWVISKGLPCKMVTWDGVYDKPDWRKPANIFRRGDQSNCLTRDRYTDQYDAASPDERSALEARANGVRS